MARKALAPAEIHGPEVITATPEDIAAAEKLDFVLQSAIFVDPKNDLTDRVLKALDGN